MASKSDLISRYRAAVAQLINAIHTHDALKAEWDALNYTADLTDADFVGSNSDITKADLVAAVTSVIAIKTAIANGSNAANLYRVKA